MNITALTLTMRSNSNKKEMNMKSLSLFKMRVNLNYKKEKYDKSFSFNDARLSVFLSFRIELKQCAKNKPIQNTCPEVAIAFHNTRGCPDFTTNAL